MQNANQGQQNWGQGVGGNMGGNTAGGGSGSAAVAGNANNQMTAQMYQQYSQAMAAYGQQQGQGFGNWGQGGQNMGGYGGGNQGQGQGNYGWNQGQGQQSQGQQGQGQQGQGQWGNQGQGQNQMWNQNQQGQGQGNFQGGGGGMNQQGMNQQGWGNNNMKNQGGGHGGGNSSNNQPGQWGDGSGQNSGGNLGNRNQGRSPRQGGGSFNGSQMGDIDNDNDGNDGDNDGAQKPKGKHRGGQKVRQRRELQEKERQQKQQNQNRGGDRGNRRGGGGGGNDGGNPNKRQRTESQGNDNQGNRARQWSQKGGNNKNQLGGQNQGGTPQTPQVNQWGEGSAADMLNIQNKITRIADRVAKKLAIANSDDDKFDFLEDFIKDAADTRGESLFKFETILNKLGLQSTLVFLRDLNHSSVCRFYMNDIYIAQGNGLNQTKSKANVFQMADDVFKDRNWRSKLVCDQKLRQDTFMGLDVDITFISYPDEKKTLETTQFNKPQQVTQEWASIVLLEKTGVFQGANGVLKQSVEFNNMVLEYDYKEPEKSVCKCQVLVQNTCVAEAEKTKRNKAKSAASHLALEKIRKTNWTIKIIRTEFPACGNVLRRKTPVVVLPDDDSKKTDDYQEKKEGSAEPMSLDDFLKSEEKDDKDAPPEAAAPVPALMEEDQEVDDSGFTPPKPTHTPADIYTDDEMTVRNDKFYAWVAPQTALDKLAIVLDEYKAKDSVDDLILTGFNVDERFNIINYCKYAGLDCVAKRWYDDVYLFVSLVLEPQVLLDKIMALGGKTDKYELIAPTGTEEEPEDDGMAEARAAMAYVPEQTNGDVKSEEVKGKPEIKSENTEETKGKAETKSEETKEKAETKSEETKEKAETKSEKTKEKAETKSEKIEETKENAEINEEKTDEAETKAETE